ncbi:MAG: LamG domain-containing protein [Burkholderiales bacterium]|nr:LamG domain-containing protein [Burkholderiales bacterium]
MLRRVLLPRARELAGLPLLVLLWLPLRAGAVVVGFHDVQTVGVNAAAITIAVPGELRSGDMLLAAITVRNAPAISAPGGWTLLRTDAAPGALRTALFYRAVSGGEAASYTWTFSESRRAAGLIVAYRGVSAVATSGGNVNASGSSNIVAPSVTPGSAGTTLVSFFSVRNTTAVASPASMAKRADMTSSGTGVRVALADEYLPGPAATGTRTATSSNDENIGQSVVLVPVAAAATPNRWYRLDEASWSGAAGEVADSGSDGRNGTALGASPVTGIKCRAGSFTPPSSRIDIPFHASQNMQSTFTVTAWIRPDTYPASGLMSIFSNDYNYEFHVTPTGALNWWWNDGSAQLFTSGSTVPTGSWTFVAFVFTRGSQAIYTGTSGSAVAVRQTGNSTAQLTKALTKLQIGDDQDFSGRRWDGLIDDVRVYDQALTAAELNAVRTYSAPCASVDHYRVQNNASGVNCQAEPVTITPHDAAHAAQTLNSSTTITVTAQYVSGAGGPGSRGDWSVVTGGGTLGNGTPDDGVATYTFAAGGESSVVLALRDTWAQTVNVSVTDGAATDTTGTAGDEAGYDQTLAFHAGGFRFVDAGNALLPGQVSAVTSSTLYLQAVRSGSCAATGACTGACTVAPGFAAGASVAVDLASECVNPAACQPGQQVTITNNGSGTIASNHGGSVASYTSRNLLFGSHGMAAFTLDYPDAGAIRLHARYAIPPGGGGSPSNSMTGASNSFVVKPHTLVLSDIRRSGDGFANPGAGSAAGAVFVRAGEDFSVTVTARNAVGNATPSFGQEGSAEGVRLTAALVPGLGLSNNPTLANATQFGSFSAGSATGTAFSWPEVGIVTLAATVADGDYLGAGEVAVVTSSGNVGRFTAHHFTAGGATLTNRVAAGCSPASSFTYIGEPLGAGFALTARAAAGMTTLNYASANAFARLPGTAGTSSPPSTMGWGAVNAGTDLTSRIDLLGGTPLAWVAGVANVSTSIALARAGAPDGPFAALALGIAPVDQDGAALATAALNLDVDGSGGNERALLGTTALRFGRLKVHNALGSGLTALPVPFETQYHNGFGFVTNAADSCTQLLRSDVMFRNFQKNLSACETGATTPPAGLVFSGGRATLTLTKPVAGADGAVDGSVDLMPRLSAAVAGNSCLNGSASAATSAGKSWLQFDWAGTGVHGQNPSGRAAFGLHRGASEFIYFRELY